MMQRREFLGYMGRTAIAGGAALAAGRHAWPLADASAGTARRASVTDFGADSTGQKDSTAAVQKAIASLARRNARLVFPAGKYTFAASNAVLMDFNGYEGLEIFGNGAELSFAGATQPIRLTSCKDLEVHDIIVDWTQPSCSQASRLDTAALLLNGCEQILLETVVFHAAPGAAVRLCGCRDITLDTVRVDPASWQRTPGLKLRRRRGDSGLHRHGKCAARACSAGPPERGCGFSSPTGAVSQVAEPAGCRARQRRWQAGAGVAASQARQLHADQRVGKSEAAGRDCYHESRAGARRHAAELCRDAFSRGRQRARSSALAPLIRRSSRWRTASFPAADRWAGRTVARTHREQQLPRLRRPGDSACAGPGADARARGGERPYQRLHLCRVQSRARR